MFGNSEYGDGWAFYFRSRCAVLFFGKFVVDSLFRGRGFSSRLLDGWSVS